MELDDLERLIELMNDNDLVEVEIEKDDSKIRLRKAAPETPTITAMPAMPQAMFAPQAPVAPAAHAAAAPVDAGGAASADPVEGDSLTFNSPMVGTFYTAPSPGADTFVKIGDKVGQTTVLCIIEAMKVMNEIQAEMEGEILEVLVGNGEAVEYGQPLFTLKPR